MLTSGSCPQNFIGLTDAGHALLSYKARCDYLRLRVGPERAIVERGRRPVYRRRTEGARSAKIWPTLFSLVYYRRAMIAIIVYRAHMLRANFVGHCANCENHKNGRSLAVDKAQAH